MIIKCFTRRIQKNLVSLLLILIFKFTITINLLVLFRMRLRSNQKHKRILLFKKLLFFIQFLLCKRVNMYLHLYDIRKKKFLFHFSSIKIDFSQFNYIKNTIKKKSIFDEIRDRCNNKKKEERRNNK